MKIITASEAAALIPDGAFILTSIDGMTAWPEEIALAMAERYKKEGHPADITHIHGAGAGDFGKRGENVWCLDGMMTRNISSYIEHEEVSRLVAENKIKAWFYPLGAMLQVFREVGRGMPGALSKIGLGTFMDPRFDGGALNQAASDSGEKYIEYIPDFLGEEYLFYKGWDVDAMIVRAAVADKKGNISNRGDAMNTEMLACAQVAKARGGIVIVQVDKIVETGEIHPMDVKIPSMYVDYVVQTEDLENAAQNMARNIGSGYNPAFTGEEKAVLSEEKPPLPLSANKVIARRAAMELKGASVINLGIGMPQTVADIMHEEGLGREITLLSETGVIGGVPAVGRDFGCHWNPEALADHVDQFSYYDGGSLKYAMFGLSEVDETGGINTTHLNGMIRGVGGFVDIATNSKNSIFLGTFTTAGLKAEIENGKLVIAQEGKIKKFIKKCEKVTFAANEAVKKGNKILFITERCVLRFTDGKFILEEIAPGVDVEKDILANMDFTPVIPEGGPKVMDEGLFREKWGGLKAYLDI